MILHLCRLAWNRRRTNLLLVGELTLVFLIVALIGVRWVLFAVESLKPLGFEYEDVWAVRMDWPDPTEEQESALWNTIELVRREIQALGPVESVALAEQSPFGGPGVWINLRAVNISRQGLETLGLQLHSGRWFEPEDEAQSGNRHPVVLDLRLSRALFGNQDPLGEIIDPDEIRKRFGQGGYTIQNITLPEITKLVVVGVVEDCIYYGKQGSGKGVPGTLFFFFSNASGSSIGPGVHLLVKTPLGTGPDFGEKLRSEVRAVVPVDQTIRFRVGSLGDKRDRNQARQVEVLKTTALLSSLLMLMVTLGLTGIMWQNVRRRTREIGVRRAVGAVGGNVYGLFLGELAVLATAAIALGCVPIVQFDLANLIVGGSYHSHAVMQLGLGLSIVPISDGWIPTHVLVAGLAAGASILYLLVLLCGLYPSWLAARVRPAEALHHD